MAQWTNADPGAGSLGQIDGSITNASSMATDIDNVLQATTASKNSVGTDLWAGSASVAWHASAIGAMSNLPSMRNTLTDSIAALQTYRDAVSDIDSRAEVWKTTLDTTTSKIHGSFPFRWPWETEEMKEDELKRERNLEKHYEAIEKLAALGGERETADSTLVAALNEALPTDWPQQHAAFVAAGLDDADKINSESVLAAMEELALGFSDFDSGENPDVETLSALMGLYGRDENMMSDFFTNLGGSNTLSIIDRIGADASKGRSEEENLLLGQQIRDGLSRGSSDWDSATAEKFADDMFNGDQEYWLDAGIHNGNTVYGRPEAIAWLFSSPDKNPMGAELSLASALQIDQYERENGGKPWGDFAYATGGPNGAALWMLENPGAEGYHAIDDTASLIFQNLALYVDHTIDFLDPESGEGEDRVAYWFGDRDWSQSDGFEGPGKLWYTAQTIEGGPFSENPTPEGTTWAADLASRIMFELAENPSFIPESMSDEGSAVLANNLAPHLPGIADYIYRHGVEDPDQKAGVWNQAIFGSDGEQILPIVTEDLISKLLGTIGSNEIGAQYLSDNFSQLQNLYMTAELPAGETMDDAIKRATAIQGALDGSGIGALLAEARRADTAADAQIDGIMSAVNLIPIPGASKLFVDGGIKIIDKVQGIVVKELKGGMVDSWKESMHVYDDLKLDLAEKETNQQKINQVKASSLIFDAFPDELAGAVGEKPVQGTYEADEAFLDRAYLWSSETADEMAALTGSDPLALQVDYSNAHTAYNTKAEDHGQ